MGRTLSNVDGVLNGATSAVSPTLATDGLNASSLDVFVTITGLFVDGHWSCYAHSLSGLSGEFTENADPDDHRGIGPVQWSHRHDHALRDTGCR